LVKGPAASGRRSAPLLPDRNEGDRTEYTIRDARDALTAAGRACLRRPQKEAHEMTNLRQHVGRIHRLGFPVLAAAAIVVLALAILGCSSSTTTTTAPPSPAGSATTGGSGGSGTAADVTMQNIAFSPQSVTIKAGDTVVWTNKDSVEHDVTAADGSFKSGILASGATFSHPFAQAGTYEYSCTLHPGMNGTVIVQ
jgi:plastocyanin